MESLTSRIEALAMFLFVFGGTLGVSLISLVLIYATFAQYFLWAIPALMALGLCVFLWKLSVETFIDLLVGD